MAHLTTHHWENFMFIPKVKRFLGTPFGTGRGVTQGDPAPPHDIQYLGRRGSEGDFGSSLQPPGGAAWDGVVGGRAQPDILRGRREDQWEGPYLVTRRPDGFSSNFLTDWNGDEPGED